jgi:hypothetical protein
MNENTQEFLMTSSATSSQPSLNSFLYTNPTVIVPSSALQPHTIPIYSLKQAATFSSTSTSSSSSNNIETQNSKLLLTTTTAAVAAATPTTNHSASNGHQSNDSEWTNSLFRPASRFALKRRECKSTSDESFTFEVTSHVNTNGNSNNEFLLTSISSLNSGKFGFNPTSRRLSSLTGIITPSTLAASSASNSGASVFKKNHSFSNGAESTTSKLASMKNQREKKNVKRLSAGNKFFIEHHSKKSQDKKDCKHCIFFWNQGLIKYI